MKMIDISVLVGKTIPVWEGDYPPSLTEEKSAYAQGTIQTTTVMMNVHTGTHIDAPRHFFQNGSVANEILLEKLVGSCVVIRITKTESPITKEDLEASGIKTGCRRVLIKTANSELWQKAEGFQKNYIALDPSAADYLVDIGVELIGIDYLSIAPFENVWDVHQTLLSNKIVILEGLNLKDVRPGEYKIICLPMKIDSKDGLPVRAVLVENGNSTD